MKILVVILGIVLSACTVQSNLVTNKDGFVLHIDEGNHIIKAGQSKEITVNILRSEALVNKPVKFKLLSPIPDGLSVSFNPQTVTLDTTLIRLSAATNAKQGLYTIVLSGDASITSLPSKGIVFKLVIN